MAAKLYSVSDEVWAQLDPRAGALSRAAVRRIVTVVAAIVIVAVASAVLWMSGLVRPKLAWSNDTGYGSEVNPNARTFATDVVIHNSGWTAMRVTGVGGDTPGLHLTGLGQPHISTYLGRTVPFTLQPGQTAILSVAYTVTDCAAVTSGPFRIPVRVKRFWGTQTVGISLPKEYASTVPMTPARPTEWQRSMTDQACRTTRP